jgi:hypothetical protein
LTETPLLLAELAGRLGVHYSAAVRWSREGVKGGRQGARITIRLETYRLGGHVYTTEEALGRFVDAQSGAPAPAAPRLRREATT